MSIVKSQHKAVIVWTYNFCNVIINHYILNLWSSNYLGRLMHFNKNHAIFIKTTLI